VAACNPSLDVGRWLFDVGCCFDSSLAHCLVGTKAKAGESERAGMQTGGGDLKENENIEHSTSNVQHRMTGVALPEVSRRDKRE